MLHLALDDFRVSGTVDPLNQVPFFILTSEETYTPSMVREYPCGETGSCFGFTEYRWGDGFAPKGSTQVHGSSGDWAGNAAVCTIQDVQSDHNELMADPAVIGLVQKILDEPEDPFQVGDCKELAEEPVPGLWGRLAQVSIQGQVEVEVTDSTGNTAGQQDGGYFVNTIEGLGYDPYRHGTILSLPAGRAYTLIFLSQQSDPLQLQVTDFQSTGAGGSLLPAASAVFFDIPSAGGAIYTFTVDLSTSFGDFAVAIDIDGNGEVDEMLLPTMNDAEGVRDYSFPTTLIQADGNQNGLGFYDGDVTITLSATDTGTGVYQTQYSLDGGKIWLLYNQPFTLTDPRVLAIQARSVDRAGNQESPWKKARLRTERIWLPAIGKMPPGS